MTEHNPTGKPLVSNQLPQRKSLWFLFFTPLALLLMVSCSLFPLRLPFALPFLDRFYQSEQDSTQQPVLTLTAILQQLTLPSDQDIIPSITPGRLTRAASTQTAAQGQTDQPQPFGDGEGTAGVQTGTLSTSGTPRPTGTQTRVPTSTWYIYYFPTRTSVSSNYTRTPTRTVTKSVTPTRTKTLTPTIDQSATSAAETAVFTKQTQTAVARTQMAAACSVLPDIIAYNADGNNDGIQDLILTDTENICWQLLSSNNNSHSLLGDWSPDGNQLVLEIDGDLYLIASSGGLPDKIDISLEGTKSQAAWSSSNKIVFRNVSDGRSKLYIMNSDGSSLEPLLPDEMDNEFSYSFPTWSPDGSQVAFISNRDGSTDLYILTISGGAITQLTNDEQVEDAPRWSPVDSNKIIFSAGSPPDLYIISTTDNWATPDTVAVTDDPSSDSQPDWSSDGTQIIWISDRDEGNEIYITSSSGGGAQEKINSSTSDNQRPRWKPQP